MALAVIAHDTDAPIDWQPFSYRQAFPKSVGACGGWPTRCTEAAIVRDSDVRERRARGEIPASIDELAGAREDFAPRGLPAGPLGRLSLLPAGGRRLRRSARARAGARGGRPARRLHLGHRRARDLRRGRRRGRARCGRHGGAAPRDPLRREGGSAEGRAVSGHRLDEHMVVEADGTVRCATCGHGLGAQQEGYKLGAVEQVRGFRELGLLRRDPGELIDYEVIMRHYFSP